MAHLPVFDFTARDYDALLARLVAAILAKPALAGFDTSPGNPDMAIIEAIAEQGDFLSQIINANTLEATLFRARLRQSVIDHCAGIDYRLSTATPATVTERFTLARTYPDACTFPAGTPIQTEDSGVTYELDAPLTIAALHLTSDGAMTEGRTVSESTTGASAGSTPDGQRYAMAETGFLWGSERVTVGASVWTRVDNFLNSSATSRHYRVEIAPSVGGSGTSGTDRATLIFGDGTNGARPTEGIGIALSYRVGGGKRGRVRRNRLTRLVGSFTTDGGDPVDVSVTNPGDSSGGEDRETIAHAKIAAPMALRATTRTVAREDFELHAMEVSGVARALCHTRNEDAGISWLDHRVYLVPTTITEGSAIPDATLIEAVRRYLTDPYPAGRPKGAVDGLHVVSAQYMGQTVAATLHMLADVGTSDADLQAEAVAALAALFDPRALRDGTAEFRLRFGVPVHRSEIIDALQALAGVDWVELVTPSSEPTLDPQHFPRLIGTPSITIVRP